MAINLRHLRELNTLTLYTTKSTDITVPYFSAPCTSTVDLNFTCNTADLLGSNGFAKTATGAVLTQMILPELMNTGSGISFDRVLRYSGSQPMDLSFDCYLATNGDYETNVANPINNLLDLILPVRNGLYKSSKEVTDAVSSKLRGIESGSSIWTKLAQAVDDISDWIGDVYQLNLPLQLEKTGECAHLSLVYGKLNIKEVFVTSVHVAIPKSFMEDVNGKPIPDYVKLTLGIQTKRNIEKGYITF